MVARAYSPQATAEKVIKAVQGATIVIYFGHGVGTPNRSDTPSAATTNGWGLNGPGSDGKTNRDTLDDGALTYYGEEWIAEHARPAPGWVMIYSNACYAPAPRRSTSRPTRRRPQSAERLLARAAGRARGIGLLRHRLLRGRRAHRRRSARRTASPTARSSRRSRTSPPTG